MRLQTERTAAALMMAAGAPERMETSDQVMADITTLFQSKGRFCPPQKLGPTKFQKLPSRLDWPPSSDTNVNRFT